jgi:hypothetical protein
VLTLSGLRLFTLYLLLLLANGSICFLGKLQNQQECWDWQISSPCFARLLPHVLSQPFIAGSNRKYLPFCFLVIQ